MRYESCTLPLVRGRRERSERGGRSHRLFDLIQVLNLKPTALNLTRPYTSIFASIVIFAFSNFEIGHPAFALSAAV